MEAFLFYLMAAVVIFSSLMFILHGSTVHSVLFFFLATLGLAGLFFLLAAPFIGALQILIYSGAITVLILFVVMLTGDAGAEMPVPLLSRTVPAFIVSALFFLALTFVLIRSFWSVTSEVVIPTVADLGKAIFYEYLLPFELTSIILLVAIVGAIYIAGLGRAPE